MKKQSDPIPYMQRCLQLARLGEYYVAPNPMVGAVLVNATGDIVAEGWHRQFGGPHAEVNCIRQAEEKGITSFDDCTLYVSLEPCSHYGKTPPCARLLIEKRIPRVVIGQLDPNPQVSGRGVQMLREAGVEVEVGVCEAECRRLNRRFLCLHEKHRPYVTLKWAQTADGFIDRIRSLDGSEACHQPLVISSPVTKQLVHQIRAENMAIMVGTRTALMDNPRLLTTRWAGRNPIRVLPDRHHVVPRSFRIFSNDSQTLVYEQNTDWEFILQDLASRGVHSLLVEGGKLWLDTIFRSGIWDEVHIEAAPVKIGEGVPAPLFPMDQPAAMDCILTEQMTIQGHKLYTYCRSQTDELPLPPQLA